MGSTYVVPNGFLLLRWSLVAFAGRGGGAHVAVGDGRHVVGLVQHSEALNGLGHLLQGFGSFFLDCRLEQELSVSYSGSCKG